MVVTADASVARSPAISDPNTADSKTSESREESHLAIWRTFANQMGWRSLVLFVCGFSLVGQLGTTLTGGALRQLLWKSRHLNAETIQLYNAVAALPGSMMPALSLFMQAFPIFRRSRGPYVVVFSAIGLVGTLTIGAGGNVLSGAAITLCLFFINLQFSVVGVCVGSRQMERINQFPEMGPMVVVFVISISQIALFFGNVVAGILTHFECSPTLSFLLASLPLASSIIIGASNFFEEEEHTMEQVRCFRKAQLTTNWVLTFLSTLIFALGLPFAFFNVFAPDVAFYFGICVILSILGVFGALLRPLLAKFFMWLILIGSVVLVNSGAAQVYFLTDSAEVYPAGPHWSNFMFATILPILGNVSTVAGMIFYSRFMTTWTFRGVFAGCFLLLFVLSQLDTLLYSRENLSFGIPDAVLVVGFDVLSHPTMDFIMQAVILLVSKLCVPGLEMPTIALMSGTFQLACSVSLVFGSKFYAAFGVGPDGTDDTASFKNYWLVTLLGSLGSIWAVVWTYFFIPKGKQTEELEGPQQMDGTVTKLDEHTDCDKSSMTAGSLWNRCIGPLSKDSVSASAGIVTEGSV